MCLLVNRVLYSNPTHIHTHTPTCSVVCGPESEPGLRIYPQQLTELLYVLRCVTRKHHDHVTCSKPTQQQHTANDGSNPTRHTTFISSELIHVSQWSQYRTHSCLSHSLQICVVFKVSQKQTGPTSWDYCHDFHMEATSDWDMRRTC